MSIVCRTRAVKKGYCWGESLTIVNDNSSIGLLESFLAAIGLSLNWLLESCLLDGEDIGGRISLRISHRDVRGPVDWLVDSGGRHGECGGFCDSRSGGRVESKGTWITRWDARSWLSVSGDWDDFEFGV